MRVRVIEKGVNDKDGNSVAKGTVIEVEGDTIPAWLVNKAVPADDGDGKTFVTNPAKPLTKAEQKAKDKADAAERADLVESAKLLGVVVTDEMSVDEIKSAIENAGK